MGLSSVFRVPRPKTFFYVVSLKTATEFIAFTLVINKVSGFYGILALLTGYHLSPIQLSMYFYSLVVLGLLCYLSPHIKRQSPLQCLALAWVCLLDSAINAAYTVLFGAGWFVLLAQHLGEDDVPASPVPGSKMMNDTAGFTSPETNVSRVDVVATPAAGPVPGQDAVAVGSGDGSALGNTFFQSGSIASVSVIGGLWLVRVYFCIVVMSYARSVLRQHILMTSATSYGADSSTEMAENPFREGREEGEGWKGKLGRVMTSVGRGYWLGKDNVDEEWVRGAGDRFKRLAIQVPPPGVGERERRARSGTGPPPNMVNKQKQEKTQS
ncbi:hypothetical protein MBLNU459_g6578t1 [Dothideomycetes sp. NU459]